MQSLAKDVLADISALSFEQGPSDSNALEEGRRTRLQLQELQIIAAS